MKKVIYIGFVAHTNGVTELVSCSDKSKRKAGELLDKWIAENTVKEEIKQQGVLTISDSDYMDIG
jgi:hypothetical protein